MIKSDSELEHFINMIAHKRKWIRSGYHFVYDDLNVLTRRSEKAQSLIRDGCFTKDEIYEFFLEIIIYDLKKNKAELWGDFLFKFEHNIGDGTFYKVCSDFTTLKQINEKWVKL